MGNLHILPAQKTFFSHVGFFLVASQQIALHLSETSLAQMSAEFWMAKKMTVYKLLSGNYLFM